MELRMNELYEHHKRRRHIVVAPHCSSILAVGGHRRLLLATSARAVTSVDRVRMRFVFLVLSACLPACYFATCYWLLATDLPAAALRPCTTYLV